jgi:riboflavin synthase
VRIRAPYRGLKTGESIAVNGACLTVEKVMKADSRCMRFRRPSTDANWGLAEGPRGQFERAVRAADLLGGHIVQGHVDGVGTVERVVTQGDALLLDVRLPPEIAETTILHGSITV